MIRDFIYYMPIVISIIGAFSIISALKNKNKKNNKLIIIFNIINILYLFCLLIMPVLIHDILPIIVDLTVLFIWFISIIGGGLYLISTIICICRRKKLNENSENKLSIKKFIIIIITPIIICVFVLCKEVHLIKNSEFVLSYHASGNGGFADSKDFVYAISDKNCSEISIDVDFSYNYNNKIFILKKLKKVTENELHNKGYQVIIDKYINVYKNQKLIHKKKLNERYFNTKLDNIFYNE